MSTVIKDLGAVSAYAYAVEKGYTGTEAEFAELMADYAEVGQRAEDAAESALNSKTAAQTAATTATNKASEATTAAQTATTNAGEAQTSAQTASSKASEASQSALQASGYAQTAETAKTDAQTAKTQAETARDEAVTAKTAAETAQGKAEDAQAAAESVAESIPSDYSQLSEDVSDLKEGLNEITEQSTETVTYDMDSDVFTTQGGYIHTDGSVKSASSAAHGIWYFQASEDMSVYLTNLASATNKYNLVIYSGTPLTSSGMVTYKGGTELPTESDQLSVESGQYVAVSIYNQTNPAKKNFNLVCTMLSDAIALASTLGLTTTMNDEVETLIDSDGANVARTVVTNSKENIFVNDGWETLPVDKFARNAWADYNSIDSRASRVRYTEDLVFDRDVTLLAKEGFYLVAFTSDASAFYDANTYIDLPVGRTIHVYVRRITENSSETASVEEFADALLISTPLADMERLAHTFTDISMFERVGIGGDSYAAGGGIISGVRPLTWGKNLERQAGIIVDIYAKSGETVVQWNSDATNGLPALLAGTECGLYWLAHGINGTSTDEAIGSVSDMSESPRPQTFYGQYAEAIEQIKTAFPNARIVIQTICGSSYKLYQANYNKVNTAIRNIAEYCGIPLIDVADDDFYKSSQYSSNIRSNHPTAMVAAGMAHANRRLIAKCILDNPDYFIRYGAD